MTSTDVSSCVKPHVHRRISLRTPLRCGFTILLCSCLFAGAAQCRARVPQDAAQDVAEAARQERARKEAKKTKHVYTEEDLRRAKILTPDDEARVEARRQQQAQPAEEQAQAPIDADGQLAQLPLGDIARRYRNAKLAAQTPDPFHLPFDEPVFAAPVFTAPAISVPAVAAPRPSYSAAHPTVAPSRRNAVVPPALPNPAPLHRVDPFARRLAPPAPPSVSRIAPQPNAAPVIAPSSRPHFVTPAPSPKSSASTPKLGAVEPLERPAAKANPATSIARPFAIATASAMLTVTMQPGDSLWKLAQEHLGSGSRWQELLAANPGVVDPARIAAGTEIVVPAKLTGLKSDVHVRVKQGDTLTKIAQMTYGRAAAWRCIAQANPELADVDRIYTGQQLLLPFACQK
jgi:LysM repeat protein